MAGVCGTEMTLQIKSERVDEDQNIDDNNPHSNIMNDNHEEMTNDDNTNGDNIDYNQQSHNNSLCIEKDHQELLGSIKSEFNIEELLIKTEYQSDNENEEIYEYNHHSYISVGDGNNETISYDNSDKDPLENEQCKQFQCHICEKGFKKQFNLKIHLLVHAGKTPYQCDRCDRKFVHQSTLKGHLLSHIRNDRHECHICGKLFSQKYIDYHLLTHTDNRPYQCDICNRTFKSKYTLKTHLWRQHTVNKILHHCNICGKMFWNNEDLEKHSSLHAERESFDEGQKINEEIQKNDNKNGDDTHYNQQPENNKLCTGGGNQEIIMKVELKNEEFLKIANHSEKINEDQHSRISLRDRNNKTISYDNSDKDLLVNKKFQCNICDKKIIRKETFERHLYLHVAEKTYHCNRCDRKFVYKSGLKKHELTHSRDKCYPCNTCGKMFATTVCLERHSLAHTDERPYQCDICNKKFKSKYNLKAHLSAVHTVNKILHHCNICGKMFWRNEDLEKHSSLHAESEDQRTNGNNHHSNIMIDNNEGITNIGNKSGDITDNNQQLEKNSLYTGADNQESLGSIKSEFDIGKICLKIENQSEKIYENGQRARISLRNFNNEPINNDNFERDPLVTKKYKQFHCNVCNRKFKKKWGLKTHLLIHADKKSHDCNICKRKFVYKGALKKHLMSHTGMKYHQSNISDKEFTLNQNLKLRTDEKPYQCNICNKQFKTACFLKFHLSWVHSENKLYQCHICGEDFLKNEDLKEHLPVHAGLMPNPLSVKNIEETFLKIENHYDNEGEVTHENNQHSSISLHDRRNNESISNDNSDQVLFVNGQCNYKFECSICKKKFKRENTLKLHLYFHFAEKPHHCNRCDKKFIWKSTLKKHLLGHIREKRYQCDICGKKLTKKQLEFHSTVHINEKPYHCDICNRKYKSKHRLKIHLLVHSVK